MPQAGCVMTVRNSSHSNTACHYPKNLIMSSHEHDEKPWSTSKNERKKSMGEGQENREFRGRERREERGGIGDVRVKFLGNIFGHRHTCDLDMKHAVETMLLRGGWLIEKQEPRNSDPGQ